MVKKTKTPEFECLECGKKFYNVASAEKAEQDGCPKCGGSDIEIWVGTVI